MGAVNQILFRREEPYLDLERGAGEDDSCSCSDIFSDSESEDYISVDMAIWYYWDGSEWLHLDYKTSEKLEAAFKQRITQGRISFDCFGDYPLTVDFRQMVARSHDSTLVNLRRDFE